jgi:hypothetical protein
LNILKERNCRESLLLHRNLKFLSELLTPEIVTFIT